VLEDDLRDAGIGPGNSENLDLLFGTSKIDAHRRRESGARQTAEYAVSGRYDRRLPFKVSQRHRKVANDVTDSADLSFRQRAVLCGDQKYSLTVY